MTRTTKGGRGDRVAALWMAKRGNEREGERERLLHVKGRRSIRRIVKGTDVTTAANEA